MLRITIELLRYGDASNPEHLGTGYISNDGSGDLKTGNYDVKLSKRDNPEDIWRYGRVRGFPRLQKGPWDLLFVALRGCVGKRNVRKRKNI